MPFLTLKKHGLRVFLRINDSTDADDDADPRMFLNPNKPNLVFMHAAMSSSWCFQSQFRDPRLLNAFNLIAFDSRFCGRTESKPKKKHPIEDNGPEALAVLQELGLKQFNLLGQNFLGCVTATWVAILAPKMVQSLTLVSPSPLECKSEISSAMVGEWLPLALSNKGKHGDGSGTIPQECLDVVSNYFFGAVADRDLDRKEAFLANFQARYGTGRGPEELTTQAHYFQRKMIPAKKRAEVKCPVLILQGGADKMTSPVEEAQKWQDGFVNAKGGADLRTLVDAPHLLAFFSPNVTSRFILMFVMRSIGAQA